MPNTQTPRKLPNVPAPSEDEMRQAAEDLIAGRCDISDRLSFLAGLTRHIARHSVADGEDAGPLASALFVAADTAGEEAVSQQAKRPRALTPQVVKGRAIPLTPEQRELVEMFIEHLRSLPEWSGKMNKEWQREYLAVVEPLVCLIFRERYNWVARPGHALDIGDLPDHGEKFKRLMAGAATPPNPILKRRQELLELAQAKQLTMGCLRSYEQRRKELGLPPDITLPRKSATPLEREAEATWGTCTPA